MKIYEILPGRLYQRGEFRAWCPEVAWRHLRSRGIGLALCVAPSSYHVGVGALAGPWYKHVPYSDGPRCDFGLVTRTAARVGDWLRADPQRALLVHCQAGRNRASLMNALLLVRLERISGAAAVERIRKVRPNALATEPFVHFLNKVKGYNEREGRYVFE